jgi:flavin reductase (DIM6/NTAB) family NADH-FMN oxidoreductase RutF
MAIDSLHYRAVLGHFPTGVTVVTGMVDRTPVGLTIGSFTSVSLDPPLVGFLPMASSERWQQIRTSGSFAVNVLGANQADLCWRFAKSSIETPFESVAWHPGEATGAPLLDGAIAWMECSIYQVVDAGDHHFVVGELQTLSHADHEPPPRPLLFFRGGVGEFSTLA